MWRVYKTRWLRRCKSVVERGTALAQRTVFGSAASTCTDDGEHCLSDAGNPPLSAQYKKDFADFTERYSLKKKIGIGKYGNVYRSLDRLANSKDNMVAIKIMSVGEDEPAERITAMNCEAVLWATLVHENIVRLDCTYNLAKNRRAFVCQLCNSEDLFSHISYLQAKSGSCRLRHRRDNLHLMRGLLAAIDYMHNTAKIVHRDIKPENIMIHYEQGCSDVGQRALHEARILLGDFTFSEKIGSVTERPFHAKVGTLVYVAPEIWMGHRYGASVDCWAAGVVLYECQEGRHPCWTDNLGEDGTVRDISRAICEHYFADFNHTPLQEQLLLDGLLTSSVAERMGAEMANAAAKCIRE